MTSPVGLCLNQHGGIGQNLDPYRDQAQSDWKATNGILPTTHTKSQTTKLALVGECNEESHAIRVKGSRRPPTVVRSEGTEP